MVINNTKALKNFFVAIFARGGEYVICCRTEFQTLLPRSYGKFFPIRCVANEKMTFPWSVAAPQPSFFFTHCAVKKALFRAAM